MAETEHRHAVYNGLYTCRVRQAHYADADAILGLAAELRSDGESGGGDAAALVELVDNPDNDVFVAEADGRLAGWVHVFMARRVGMPAFAEIGGLVTRAEFRRRGVGRALVRRCESWARTRHGASLRVRCDIRRQGANLFYRAVGFIRSKDQVVHEKNI